MIDEEVRRLVEDAHAQVTQLLSDYRDQLESLTRALLEAETLDAIDAYAAAVTPMPRAELQPEASSAPDSGVAHPPL